MVPSQIKHLESQSLSIELTMKIFSKSKDSSSDGDIWLESRTRNNFRNQREAADAAPAPPDSENKHNTNI